MAVWRTVGVALAVRLVLILLVPPGYPGDMAGWADTTERMTHAGLPAAYAVLEPGSLYPPAFLYPLWAAGQLYTWCCSPEFQSGTRSLDQIMLLGPIVADSLLAGLVCELARRWLSEKRAQAAGLLYALSPAALTTVAWQGMIGDPLYGVLVMAALLGALSRRPVLAAVCITLAVLTKPQGLAFVPLAALVAARGASPRHIVAALGLSVASIGAVLLPFALTGSLSTVWSAVQGMSAIHAYTQNSADNLWLLLQVGDPAAKVSYLDGAVPDSGIFFAGLSYQTMGLLLFGSLYLATLVVLRRAERLNRAVTISGGVIGFGFFFLNTRMHVNYSFMGFPFLCVLSAGPRLRARFALASTTIACLVDWDVFGHWPWPDGLPVHLVSAAAYGLGLLLVCSLAVTAIDARAIAALLGRRGRQAAQAPARRAVPISS